jgi:hypothetical protein
VGLRDTSYGRWVAGRCPCCGAGLEEWIDGTKPQAVAEGVIFCGRCMANEHDETHVVSLILLAIAERSDRAIERHLGGLG